MLQEEPLQPLALEPLTEEEQVGQAQAGPGTGQHCGWVSGAGGWVLTATPAPSSEKLLPVSEQRGCAEADGERGQPSANQHLPRQGQHAQPR